MKGSHTEVSEFLTKQGFTRTEIFLYIAGLEAGPQTASELAKRSGIKRTTAQSAVTNLVEKGMMSRQVSAGASLYTTTDPALIERTFTERIDDLKKQHLDFINLLPLFDGLVSDSSSVTEVSSFHGKEGVKTAVDTALFCSGRRWKIIAPEKNLFSEGDKDYAEYFIRIRKQRGIKAQSLWEPGFIKGRTFDATAFEFRNPRILPKALVGRFKTTIILFDASTLFVNSADEMSAVLIRSADIHDTLEVFFDGLWTNAKKIPKRKTV